MQSQVTASYNPSRRVVFVVDVKDDIKVLKLKDESEYPLPSGMWKIVGKKFSSRRSLKEAALRLWRKELWG
jgi:hypothetical protein